MCVFFFTVCETSSADNSGLEALLGEQHLWPLRCGQSIGSGHGVRLLLAKHAQAAGQAELGAHPLLQVSQVQASNKKKKNIAK